VDPLRRSAAGLQVEAAEGSVVSHDQGDGPRAGHRGVQRRAVRAGLVVHRALRGRLVAVVVVDGHPDAQEQQGDGQDQG